MIKQLILSGSFYEMGYQHGQAYRDDIRHFAEERLQLSMSDKWAGVSLSRKEVLALAEACVAAHQQYAPDLMAELQGMSAATDLSLAELVIVNGFTDFIDTVYHAGMEKKQSLTPSRSEDNCTAFIIPNGATTDGHGFFGQTWDMHDTATPFVRLLRIQPTNGLACLVFTITGCVGMIGMNEAGIAIGINNLLGGDGQVGVTWPFVVRQALAQSTIDDALACITQAPLAGAHSYLLFDSYGRGYNVEAMSSRRHVTQLDTECLVHTNHCLIPETHTVERKRLPESQASSENRLHQADTLLAERPITVETLMALTRDPNHICVISEAPLYLETCGAAIMRPATGEFWAVWGLPTQNEYERFTI